MIGKWTICHSSVQDLRYRVHILLKRFFTCGVVYIPRKCNADAKALANKAIDFSSQQHDVPSRYVRLKPFFLKLLKLKCVVEECPAPWNVNRHKEEKKKKKRKKRRKKNL